MAAVDFLCQPFYFDLDEQGLSLLEPLPFDSSSSPEVDYGDEDVDTGLELSLSNIVLDGTAAIEEAATTATSSKPTTLFPTVTSKGKKRPRVSFRDEATLITVPSFACLEEDQRRVLWYRPVEIDQFRASARDACRRLRDDPLAFPEDITRGLELRTSLDRQWRKHLARNCILKAQVRFPQIDSEHLASIAERCTALPREEALTQATRDYCAVYYHPDDHDYPKGSSSSVLSSSSSHNCTVVNGIPLQLYQPPLMNHNNNNADENPQSAPQQKKRPSLDLEKDEEDSSSSSESGEEQEDTDELRIHDRIAKRYRCMSDSEECLFADLDFEIEL